MTAPAHAPVHVGGLVNSERSVVMVFLTFFLTFFLCLCLCLPFPVVTVLILITVTVTVRVVVCIALAVRSSESRVTGTDGKPVIRSSSPPCGGTNSRPERDSLVPSSEPLRITEAMSPALNGSPRNTVSIPVSGKPSSETPADAVPIWLADGQELLLAWLAVQSSGTDKALEVNPGGSSSSIELGRPLKPDRPVIETDAVDAADAVFGVSVVTTSPPPAAEATPAHASVVATAIIDILRTTSHATRAPRSLTIALGAPGLPAVSYAGRGYVGRGEVLAMTTTVSNSAGENADAASSPRRVRIAIIGSGFAGLGMGIRLRQAGIRDFEILERSHDIGGTWRDNSYPGCAVDVQSHLYSYSFAPNPDWSSVYSPQQEIWAYIRRCADEFGVAQHLRLGHEVLSADWDESRQRWLVQTSAGPVEAQFLISAMGPLSERSLPDIAGLETFEGACFHSAAWDHGCDLTAKRVAVIGTGASAAQFIPEIQPVVDQLLVFQRTPPWTFPRLNRRITPLERRLYRRFPALQRLVRTRQYWYRECIAFSLQRPWRTAALERVARARLQWQVRDQRLREKITPAYSMGCKRIILSDDYHPTLARANVELITSSIREVHASSIVTADGVEHPVDAIILATGFHPIAVADPLVGRDGVALAARWAGRREAYLGTAVAGYPNYFMLVGPNTATGHTSILLYAEAQIEYIIECLNHLEHHGLASFDVRDEVQAAFNDDLRRRLKSTVWTSGGCGSWYLDADGGTSVLWPGYTWQFRRALRAFDPQAYELRAQRHAAVA